MKNVKYNIFFYLVVLLCVSMFMCVEFENKRILSKDEKVLYALNTSNIIWNECVGNDADTFSLNHVKRFPCLGMDLYFAKAESCFSNLMVLYCEESEVMEFIPLYYSNKYIGWDTPDGMFPCLNTFWQGDLYGLEKYLNEVNPDLHKSSPCYTELSELISDYINLRGGKISFTDYSTSFIKTKDQLAVVDSILFLGHYGGGTKADRRKSEILHFLRNLFDEYKEDETTFVFIVEGLLEVIIVRRSKESFYFQLYPYRVQHYFF